MSVPLIVFSRDRACQLDGLLRSFYRHLTPPSLVTVLWTSRGPQHASGYGRCRAQHQSRFVRFCGETNFRDDLERILPRDGHVCFFTDDDLLYRPASLRDATEVLNGEPDVLAFSLRLGANTQHCYPHDCSQGMPASEQSNGVTLRWPWRDASGDYGYPMSLDGHVFRAEWLRQRIEACTFSNPNELEDQLANRVAHSSRAAAPPLLASYTHSVLVNVPANRVNETHPNRHGGLVSTDDLNRRYLEGHRIDLDAMDFDDITAAHQELELKLADTA